MRILKKIMVKFNITKLPSIFFYLFRIFSIKNNKIVFVNFSGKGYGDSTKYISEKIIEKNKYDIVWLVKDMKDKELPKQIRKVKIFTIKSFYELATSKVWVNNSRFDHFVVKRKKQFYIQTWHGGLALKKIEYDAEEKMSEYYKKVMKNDNKLIDLMVSNSKFCTDMYRKAFRYNGKILEIGTPRNDILINEEKKQVAQKAKNFYKIKNEKVLLYAPTFRKSYEINPYNIDFARVKQTLEDKTKEKWVVIIKLHPRINNSRELINNIENYIDATNYRDMQELICACDLLITDYSSTMFETMIANKPVIVYANDLEKYEEDRGTYFKLSELPFPVAKDNDELNRIINEENLNDILKDYELFKKNIGLKETGYASKEIVNIIENETNIERILL